MWPKAGRPSVGLFLGPFMPVGGALPGNRNQVGQEGLGLEGQWQLLLVRYAPWPPQPRQSRKHGQVRRWLLAASALGWVSAAGHVGEQCAPSQRRRQNRHSQTDVSPGLLLGHHCKARPEISHMEEWSV